VPQQRKAERDRILAGRNGAFIDERFGKKAL